MLQSGGWTLRYDEDNYNFVIEFPERELKATFNVLCSTRAFTYLKAMVKNSKEPEPTTFEKLNDIASKLFQSAEILKRQIDEERRPLRPVQDL